MIFFLSWLLSINNVKKDNIYIGLQKPNQNEPSLIDVVLIF